MVFDDGWVSQGHVYPLEEAGKLIREHLLYINHCLSKTLKNFFATLKIEALYPQATTASLLPVHPLLLFRMRGRGRFCDDKTVLNGLCLVVALKCPINYVLTFPWS